MAKAIGQKGHLGIAKETTWGTPVASADHLKFSSESLTLGIEELVSASLASKRIESPSYEGLGSVSGDTVHEVHPNGIGYMFRSYFNQVTSTQQGATSAYEHEYTPTDTEFEADCEVQSYTLEAERNDDEAYQFAGCVVNALAFTFGVGTKILNCTASWLGKDVTEITKTSPTLETTNPFTWNQAEIKVDDVTYGAVEAMSATLENGLVAIPLLNNSKRISRIVGDAPRTGTIAPTIDVGKDAMARWDDFKAWTNRKWEIIFTGALIEGAYYYKLIFEFPRVVLTAAPIGIGGPGRLTAGLTGKIKYDSSLGYLAKVTLVNTKTAY